MRKFVEEKLTKEQLKERDREETRPRRLSNKKEEKKKRDEDDDDLTTKTKTSDEKSDEKPRSTETQDDSFTFASLMMQKEPQFFSDCIVHAAKMSIPAHKLLLAARSPVLAKMLYPSAFASSSASSSSSSSASSTSISKDDKEKNKDDKEKSGKIEITLSEDTPLSVVMHFLRYCYTGQTDLTIAEVMDVQAFAEKYQVEGLLTLCAKTMESEDMDVSGALQLLKAKSLANNPGFQRLIGSVAYDILDAKLLKNFSEEELVAFTRNGYLNCEEYELFAAVRDWAKTECKRQKIEYDIDEEKKILKNVLPHIRFPLFDVSQLAEVSSLGLLDPTDMVNLFQFKATQSKSIKIPFVSAIRQGMKRNEIDVPASHSRLSFEKDNTLIRLASGSSEWSGCVCKNPLSKGRYYFEVTLQRVGGTSSNTKHAVAIGVCSNKSVVKTASSHYLNSSAYILSTSSGKKFHENSSGQKILEPTIFHNGSVVGCECDTKTGSISYYHNGSVIAKDAFTGINNLADCYPFISMFYTGSELVANFRAKHPSKKGGDDDEKEDNNNDKKKKKKTKKKKNTSAKSSENESSSSDSDD
eukprot:TRINITY_DN204_c0_g1_i2.p1 TRINITY_DN204_c0_g1~~TRINITY_DN204_c0_g1_i2.p1  ORF type:complete len:583 (+),score=186.24 TRINITY_DN204_c0_g1_i2:18-1766(+)